ncbi:hypothetical protein [Spirilliplanes yamanashiensis]|uniref:Uncharacterized protein n=1 Tax=Spirilliplanes yamanashiensis TaxID=42233 RepID=A0A8J3Y8C7_9ACTN|nr:hypothetical protein [Spirilliplanes yamanashiensis]GIJ03856.1 hypothetical protein Sya03_32080 [Spirilliplanes yamanashiensis]
MPGGTAVLAPGLRGLGTPVKGAVAVTVTALWWVHVPAGGRGSTVTILGSGHQKTAVS